MSAAPRRLALEPGIGETAGQPVAQRLPGLVRAIGRDDVKRRRREIDTMRTRGVWPRHGQAGHGVSRTGRPAW